MDFITKLLEGKCGEKDEEVVDEKTCEEAMELVDSTGLPLSTLIESVCTDFQISINRAEEVYEMACIVGGTQVVSEGTGQSGAQVVLEGAIKNFFGMIAEKLRKLWNWILGIINKIKAKFKKKGKEVAQEAKEAAPKAKEKVKQQKAKVEAAKAAGEPEKVQPIKVPETLTIIDIKTGEQFMDKVLKGIRSGFDDVEVPSLNQAWDEKEYEEIMNTDMSDKEILNAFLGNEGFATFESIEDMKSFIRAKYMNKSRKISEELAEPLIDEMMEVCVLAGTDSVANVDKFMAPVINKIKAMEAAAKIFSMKAPDDARGKAYFSKISTMLNKGANVFTSMVNERASIISNAASAYSNFLKKVAGNSSAATESVDYSVFFESSDILEGCDSDGEDDDSKCEESYNFEGTSLAGFFSV